MVSEPSARTPAQLLAAAEQGRANGMRAEVEATLILLAWADTFSADPQDDPRYRRTATKGGPRLITLGGEGTPKVQDLALLEIAIARHEGVFTTRSHLAAGLDLRHRLPLLWAAVQQLRVPMWAARKVASMSRKLTLDQVGLVDAALAEAADEHPSVILSIAEAKVIEADPDAHQARIDAAKTKKGVWTTKAKPGDALDEAGEPGLGGLHAKLDQGDLNILEEMVDGLAEKLAEHDAPAPIPGSDGQGGCDLRPVDHYRAEALAMLADPQAVLDFLTTCEQGPEPADTPNPVDPTAPIGPMQPLPASPLPDLKNISMMVHVSAEVLLGQVPGVARVEGLGPVLLSQLAGLLRHHNVFLTPVIDLNTGTSVKGYEHPTTMKLRSELRTVGEAFPHSPTRINHTGRALDHDHPTPFDKDGPPGQTGDHNEAPLTRYAHRAKTYLGYSVLQIGPDQWVWSTPHGLHRVVTGGGTKPITAMEARVLREFTIAIADDYTPAA